MNNQLIKAAIFFLTLSGAMTACKKPADQQPVPEEQELITTMKLLVTDTTGFSQTFTYKIENGFGTTTQGTVQIDTIKLAPNHTYSVTTSLYNDKASPAENVTNEVLTERNMHLFLYASNPASGAGSVTFSNGSMDYNNKPFNQTGTITTGASGTGTLTVDLMHAPTNKDGTTPATSGGETDAETVYPVIIQ